MTSIKVRNCWINTEKALAKVSAFFDVVCLENIAHLFVFNLKFAIEKVQKMC